MFKLNDQMVTVPEWIIRKNLSQHEAYAWSVGDGERLVRETAKAVLVSQMTDFGKVQCWCPKSVLVTEEQIEAEAKKLDQAWNNGIRYNNYLKNVAADNGVKIGNLRRTEAIASKLTAKGIEFKTKAEFLAA